MGRAPVTRRPDAPQDPLLSSYRERAPRVRGPLPFPPIIPGVSDAAVRDPWFTSWFGEEYLALYPERDDREAARQAAFAYDLLVPHALGGTVRFLDLACGTGRHAVALDRDTGGVVGLDPSFPFLLAARRRGSLPAPGYVHGDMRRLPFRNGIFGAVVNFFTSFGAFDDESDDARVVAEVARVLGPGGAFLSDVLNAERVVTSLAAREEKTVSGRRVRIRRRYDPAARRVEKEIAIEDGAEWRVFRECVRLFTEEELRALHAQAGLRVASAFGDFDGSPFDRRRSPRLLLLAVKEGRASRETRAA